MQFPFHLLSLPALILANRIYEMQTNTSSLAIAGSYNDQGESPVNLGFQIYNGYVSVFINATVNSTSDNGSTRSNGLTASQVRLYEINNEDLNAKINNTVSLVGGKNGNGDWSPIKVRPFSSDGKDAISMSSRMMTGAQSEGKNCSIVFDYSFFNNTQSSNDSDIKGMLEVTIRNFPYKFDNSTLALELGLYSERATPKLNDSDDNDEEVATSNNLLLFAVEDPNSVGLRDRFDGGDQVSKDQTSNLTSDDRAYVARIKLPVNTDQPAKLVFWEFLSMNLTALANEKSGNDSNSAFSGSRNHSNLSIGFAMICSIVGLAVVLL